MTLNCANRFTGVPGYLVSPPAMYNDVQIHFNMLEMGNYLVYALITFKNVLAKQESQEVTLKKEMRECLKRQTRHYLKNAFRNVGFNSSEYEPQIEPEIHQLLSPLLEAFDILKVGRNKKYLPYKLQTVPIDQYFFIRFTQIHCLDVQWEDFKSNLGSDDKFWRMRQSRYDFIVLLLMNSIRFAETFGCATGTRMNPAKCW